MAKKKLPETGELTFEQALSRLEEIVSRLEAGEEGLEEAIALFEEGSKLSQLCQQRLSVARGKIEKLTEAAGGAIGAQELEEID